MVEDIIRFVSQHELFAITSHARPDGDSIGSSLGLALALRQLGKTARVICADPVPYVYTWLPGLEEVQIASKLEGRFDALFVLECNDLQRPEIEDLERQTVINIDHHSGTGDFGYFNWIDSSAAAVGEMIYHLIKALGAKITPEIATNLYVAILTDTGSFRFSNTTRQTFIICSELISCGAHPANIAQRVYMSQPLSKIRLLSRVLGTLQVHPSGKIASVIMTREMIEETRADPQETEGIVNHPLSIDGVKLVAFLRQDGDDSFRISLRSKDDYDVSQVAQIFGGGGHTNAAGLSVKGPQPEVLRKVITELEKLLE